jgi:hypothetical protein
MATKYQTDQCIDSRIHQCDIFRNVPFYESYSEKNGLFELSVLEFPFAIILTQECDLEQNSKERAAYIQKDVSIIKHDKFLVSLLCAPLYNAEHLFSGEHLSLLNISSEKKNSDHRNYIKTNREPRYHFIEFEDSSELVPSIIDFKHYFSLSLQYLENNMHNRLCSIRPIYREAISQRFSNYLSRIGLPEAQSK